MVVQPNQLAGSGSNPTPPLQLSIRRITKKQAQPIIEKYHYSHHVPPAPGAKFFGWFWDDGLGEKLYAVALYGLGANKHSAEYLAKITKLPVAKDNLIELIRLARVEPKIEKMQLTKFLSICHKILRKEGTQYVVSYSDPQYNPHGGIYAAANFKFVGMTDARKIFQDPEGKLVHERKLSRFQERKRAKGEFISRAEAVALFGYKPYSVPPKKRWFLAI